MQLYPVYLHNLLFESAPETGFCRCMSKLTQPWNRRRFLGAIGGAAGFLILKDARSARSYQANEKLRIAAVLLGRVSACASHFLSPQ